MTQEDLKDFGQSLSEQELTPPPLGRVLRPPPHDLADLQRLHTAACRLAETKPQILAHFEAARSLEQDLILALVACLANPMQGRPIAEPHSFKTMDRFETVLAERLSEPLHLSQLCELIGVTEKSLRSCCIDILGISPIRYVSLRRLKALRIQLKDADPTTVSLSEIAQSCGYKEIGTRVEAAYLRAFGEPPSATLCRPIRPRFFGPILSPSSE